MDGLNQMLCTTLRDGLGWPADMAKEISQYAHIVSYEKDATIFHAGESSDLLYVLLSGDVRLYYGTVEGERLLVSIVRGGQLFGSAGFHGTDAGAKDQEQLFTAQALSRAKVAIIARARVARLLQSLPGPDLVRIVQDIDARWMALCCRLLTFMTQDVRSRLAHTIGEIANSFGIPDARGKLITLRLSHEDFAELIGASRPMVSKHFKELADCGILVKESGRYILLREDALAGIAASGRASEMESDAVPPAAHGARAALVAKRTTSIPLPIDKKRSNGHKPGPKRSPTPLRYIA